MTEASTSARSSVAGGSPNYQLHSELGRICLPSSSRDETRKYAYTVSISVFFLVAGVLGLRRPELYDRVLPPPTDLTHVVELEQEKPPDTQPVPMDNEEPPPPEILTESPRVATVVAASSEGVLFPIQTPGPVVLTANPSLAQAPPAATANPNPGNGPVRFVRSKTAGGFYPDPIYPADLMRRRVTGTVELIIRVDEGGRVASVDIAKSSGNSQLDRHAVQSVKDRWRFPAGQHPPYLWACEFRLPQ